MTLRKGIVDDEDDKDEDDVEGDNVGWWTIIGERIFGCDRTGEFAVVIIVDSVDVDGDDEEEGRRTIEGSGLLDMNSSLENWTEMNWTIGIKIALFLSNGSIEVPTVFKRLPITYDCDWLKYFSNEKQF